MWKTWTQTFLLVLLATGLGGCPDYLTGQDPEPTDPLRVTRLTLFDATSRNREVFTDTSIPDCSLPANQEVPACKNDVNKDKFSPIKSPPTPDSGREVRLVFNKLPLTFNGQPLERRIDEPGKPPRFELADPQVAEIRCEGSCTGVPPATVTLVLSGSDTTSDPLYPHAHPSAIPYGPALLLEIKAGGMHPFAALEPETAYQVTFKPGLGDRNGQRVVMDARTQQLVRFTTEPFKLLRVGRGDASDRWVWEETDPDPRGPATYRVEGLPLDGVVQLVLNAPVDDSVFTDTTVTATRNGVDVPVRLSLNQLVMRNMMPACDPGKRRAVYIFPAADTWGMPGEVRITLRGAQVRDLSQAAGHPAKEGRHALRGDITIHAVVGSTRADATYKGLTTAKVRAAADCP
ncbi:MAG: hypothetical protein RMK29_11105 [Myxococcales bacterium]|nr:hypothetical protein [Myxococcota bacterium]MDW8282254.1 hypothetical protein [Myxococcales bacterium]